MADSFFGFDTTLPREEGELGKELTEDEYDALNDETFTHATTDDWEGGHETLVRFQHKPSVSNDKLDESDYDSDLDINFITKLEDFDITNDDTDIRNQFQLDPSVWATPIKPITPMKVPNVFHHSNNNNENHHMGRKFGMMQPPGLSSPSLSQQNNALQQLIGAVPNAPPKIMSLEEIERNMITQQHQKLMQERLAVIQSNSVQQPPSVSQQQPILQSAPQQMRNVQAQQPPGLMFAPPPSAPPQLNMNGPQFPPLPIPPLHMKGGPPNNKPSAKFNPLMNVTNHPMMNNFHPNFGGPMPMRPPLQQVPGPQMNRLPPHLMNIQGAPLMYQQQQQQNAQNSAQFNQRLVQEIQQNHPMLNPMFQQQQQQKHRQQQQQQQQQLHYGNPQQQHPYNNINNNINNNNHHQRYNNGKMEEYDEYANLMSNRDKQFLITIQLMQLNTETPYFDDYYYTMYKERQRFRGIENESQAFRDNQLAHPFTQPRGHAQMLLRQFNNIGNNGRQNQKNGMGRERRSSESSTKNEKENPTPRTYTPLQFENSLGKLQCGSVTAPRKIIDMEVVNNNAENGGQQAPNEKKSRQILMQIEMLYKIVLKLEDLQHPLAISATIVLKEKREKQRLQLEQEARERDSEEASVGGSAKSSISINEPETHSDLQTKLLAVIVIEKIPGIMAVRKGRALLKRIFPHIRDLAIRWDIWSAVFMSLVVFKRDKIEEVEDSLMSIYYEFAVQLQDASFAELLKITNVLMTSDKLMGLVNGCKFVVSSIIAMIIKCELIYQKSSDVINSTEELQWILFLNKLFEIVNNDRTVDAQILSSANNIHRDKNDHERIIRTVITHFQRFKARFTSDDGKLIKLLGIQYDVK